MSTTARGEFGLHRSNLKKSVPDGDVASASHSFIDFCKDTASTGKLSCEGDLRWALVERPRHDTDALQRLQPKVSMLVPEKRRHIFDRK